MSKASADKNGEASQPPVCGIVMPISALEDCTEAHWVEVLSIISDAIKDAGFRPNIVSNADEAGIIKKKIIQNLFDNPIVVCDVSGKNPNVMFELGIRLAFDKPTIVVKDDRTDYSFDTSSIEHVPYPRDLRFNKIVEFKAKLAEKIKATVVASVSDANYTTFLKHFGEFKVAALEQKEITPQEFVMEELSEIKHLLRRLNMENRRSYGKTYRAIEEGICLRGRSQEAVEEIARFSEAHPSVRTARLRRVGSHWYIDLEVDDAVIGHSEIQSAIKRAVDANFPVDKS